MVSLVQFGIIMFVALGSLTYGYCTSIIATTLGQPTFLAYFSLETASNSTSLFGVINALYATGGLFGALSLLFTADAWGRKYAILFGASCTLVGSGLQAGSVHIAMFVIARFLTGFGVGALLALVPLYQSEISPPRIRGFLVAMHGVMICFGYVSASWIGFGFYFVNANATQWRMPLAIQALPPLLLGIGVFYIPESPRWLLTQDRAEDALAAFKACRAESAEATDEHAIAEEFYLLRLQVAEELKEFVPLKEFFLRPSLRKRCFVGWLTMVASQATGTVVMNNYGALLYKRLGFSVVNQLLIEAGWISVCPMGNILNALFVDKIGRIRCLVFGLAGCVLALIGECATVATYQRTGSLAQAKAAVFFLFLHLAFFALSVDATSYIYAAEIFPNPLRARGLGISISGLFLTTIILLATAPVAFEHVGWKYYLLFLCSTTVCAAIIFFFFPETKGKALEDVADMFGDGLVLSDEKEEALHRRYKESHYRAEALEDAHHADKSLDTEVEV